MASPGGGFGGDAFLSHAAPRNSFKSDSRGEISINSASAVQKRNYSAKQVRQMKIQCTECWWIKLNVKIEEKAQQGLRGLRKRRGLPNNHENNSSVTWKLRRPKNRNILASLSANIHLRAFARHKSDWHSKKLYKNPSRFVFQFTCLLKASQGVNGKKFNRKKFPPQKMAKFHAEHVRHLKSFLEAWLLVSGTLGASISQ